MSFAEKILAYQAIGFFLALFTLILLHRFLLEKLPPVITKRILEQKIWACLMYICVVNQLYPLIVLYLVWNTCTTIRAGKNPLEPSQEEVCPHCTRSL